jgi:6-bladed beta-propeller
MNTNIKLFVSALILYLVVNSCNTAHIKDKNQIVYFNLKELPKVTEVKLSDLGFVDIEYIPLKTNEQNMIQGINNVIFGNNFFLTHFFTDLYLFRSDGKFVSKLGTVGRGPNEFTVVHDVDINRKNQNIYLADGWQRNLYVYSETGEIIKTFRIPISGQVSLRTTDNGILCYNQNTSANVEYSYNLIDTSGIIIKKFKNKYPWKIVQKNTVVFNENLFYRFNNKLYKKEVYSDTVYAFENLSFKPHLVIAHGEKLLTSNARSEYEPSLLMQKFLSQEKLFEFGDYLYYEFIYDFKRGARYTYRGFIGSKKDKTQYLIYPEQGLMNDLDGGPNIWPKTIKDDSTIISWFDTLYLKNHVASEAFKITTPKYPEKKKELEELANSLKETDNPILVLVRLKK